MEQSLRQLGTDRIDLFYLHAWDFTTHAEEVLRGLDDLVRAGKIEQAKDNSGALDISFSTEQLDWLHDASALLPIFPERFIG